MSDQNFTAKGVLRSLWVRMGLVIWAIGCGPLLLVGTLAAIGLGADRNPNPIILGIMTMFAAPLGLFCIVTGAFLYFINGGDPPKDG